MVRKAAAKLVVVKLSDGSDPYIMGATFTLVLIGCVFVFDSSYLVAEHMYGNPLRFTLRHLVSITVGLLAALALSRCHSDTLRRLAPWALGFAVLMICTTLIPGVGVCTKGACRWLDLGVFNFQPAELAKPGFILFCAALLSQDSERLRDPRRTLLPILAATGLIGALLLLQPDFGSAALIGALGIGLMFLAGVPLLHVGGVATVGLAAAWLLVFMSPYRWGRITGYLNPEADPLGLNWQLTQGLIAFGSGQLRGLGLGRSTQKSGFVPEVHSDFIFSVIGEEVGFLGSMVVLLCFAVLAFRGFRVAHRHPDAFGQILAAGLTLVITVQAIINMGVVLGLLPTKGIGLPFVSYGGSSLIIFLASTGILLSLSRELRER